MVNFSGEISGRLGAIAQEIMRDEQQHVALLRRLLGGYAIAKPTIDLNALGIGFDTFQQFLELSRAFEDTGISAHGGPLRWSRAKQTSGISCKSGRSRRSTLPTSA
jgi:Ferritin-like domain